MMRRRYHDLRIISSTFIDAKHLEHPRMSAAHMLSAVLIDAIGHFPAPSLSPMIDRM